MRLREGSKEERRAHLTLEIMRQRGELAAAYRNLHKPIELGESGLRTLGFLRQNAWVFTAIPASINVVTFLFGVKDMISGKSAVKAAATKERRAVERDLERKAPKSLLGHAMHWGGHGWRIFKIYRRIKRYLPY